MRINVDRLCELAGINSGKQSLNEAGNRSNHEDPALKNDTQIQYGNQLNEENEEEPDKSGADPTAKELADPAGEDMDELIEVDETMLVQELRRAKRLMNESRRRKTERQKQESLNEAELKKIIEHEVQNVMRDLNLTAGWIYGEDQPKRSKRGYTHQGAFLKGLGFK